MVWARLCLPDHTTYFTLGQFNKWNGFTHSEYVFEANTMKYKQLIPTSCSFLAIRLWSDRQNTSAYHRTKNLTSRVSILKIIEYEIAAVFCSYFNNVSISSQKWPHNTWLSFYFRLSKCSGSKGYYQSPAKVDKWMILFWTDITFFYRGLIKTIR